MSEPFHGRRQGRNKRPEEHDSQHSVRFARPPCRALGRHRKRVLHAASVERSGDCIHPRSARTARLPMGVSCREQPGVRPASTPSPRVHCGEPAERSPRRGEPVERSPRRTSRRRCTRQEVARDRHVPPGRILLDGGSDWQRLDLGRGSSLEGGIGIGHPVSTGGAAAVRPGRHADDRSGGTFPGIPRWLDFGVAGKSRQATSLEASWKCGVRTRGGVDRQSIVCAGALRREPRSATRFDEILACRGVERGRPQNGFWRIGISTVSAPRPSFRICYRKLAQLVGKSVERIHHEGS